MELHKERHIAYLRKGLFAQAGVSCVRSRFQKFKISMITPFTDCIVLFYTNKGPLFITNLGALLVPAWSRSSGCAS